MSMNWYKLTLTLKGATGTPWQADTIFGHLCWALRHRRGEEELRAFLDLFREELPFFLLSDGFPGDLLPRPLFMPARPAGDLEAFRAGRAARKQDWVSHAEFLRLLQGEAFAPQPLEEGAHKAVRVTAKNQISRLTGTTGGEGQLFAFVEHWIPRVTIYLKIEPGYESYVRQLFQWMAETGYGKRKSAGYGAIDDLSPLEPFEGFPAPAGANGFVTLSPFVPAATDPTTGRWRTRVKYGRLGEELSLTDYPFKRPLLMLTAGSVFFDAPVREFYGRLVRDVSPTHPEVVQYGYALPVPMRLPEAEEVDR